MSGYQVLARRYRPQRFEDLVGQDVVVRTLRNALGSGQIHHAYLFSGLRGVGKTTVARLLAKALNCERGPTPEPCGECAACADITIGAAADVQEIDAASTRGIDDIRDLREVARVLPLRDRYRVFILDEAHQLSRDAFGALLKILEEPPAHVVFVLASTDKQKFPPTILSRCLQVDFRPIPADVVAARLREIAGAESFDLSGGAAQLIARAGEGSLRDALSLLDRVRAFAGDRVDETAVAEVLGLPPFDLLVELWRALAAGDAPAALGLLRRAEQAGRDPASVYEQLIQILHALLMLACDRDAPVPIPAAYLAELVSSATEVGTPSLLRILGLALEQRHLVASTDHPGLAVAVAVGRLALWPRLRRVEALLAGETTTPRPPASDVPAARRSGPPADPAPDHQPAPADPRSRLVAALDAGGARLLAGRVERATGVELDGETLVLSFGDVPEATVENIRQASQQLADAARQAGLAREVRIGGRPASAAPEPVVGLRERALGDDRVKAALEVFGGRIDRIEERS